MVPFGIISPRSPELKAMVFCYHRISCIKGNSRMDIRMGMALIGPRIWSMLVFLAMGSPLDNAYRKYQISYS
jgi:hypothetical protein